MHKTISRIVDYAVALAKPEMVILFGSMRKGTYNRYSDLDLLIIVKEKDINKQISKQVEYYAHEFSLSADVLVYTEEEIKKAMEDKNSFISGIFKTGEIMYKQS